MRRCTVEGSFCIKTRRREGGSERRRAAAAIVRALCKWSDDNLVRRVTFLVYTAAEKRVPGGRHLSTTWRVSLVRAGSRSARRLAPKGLALRMDRAPDPPREDQQQTRRDLRAALVFGIVAATIELGAILYFFR